MFNACKVSEEPNATVCSDCKAGQSSDTKGSAKCTLCGAGKYSSVKGRLQGLHEGAISKGMILTQHLQGLWSGFIEHGRTGILLAVSAGEFGNETGMQSCHKCDVGKVSEEPNTVCSDCKAGQSSDAEGSAKCTSCAAGQYSSSGGSKCVLCPQGYFQDSLHRCNETRDGTIVLEGSAAVVQVPLDRTLSAPQLQMVHANLNLACR